MYHAVVIFQFSCARLLISGLSNAFYASNVTLASTILFHQAGLVYSNQVIFVISEGKTIAVWSENKADQGGLWATFGLSTSLSRDFAVKVLTGRSFS